MRTGKTVLLHFCRDERANIAIMASGGMVLAVCCAALGADLGSIFADRRKAQSAADLSAIVAASNLSNANAAATAALTANNLSASTLLSLETGTYTASATLQPSARFVTPATDRPNAARVTVRMQTPLYFAKFFTGASSFQITANATAATSSAAAFAIGSRLASINGGLANALLGAMLGANLSLSAMDYQALANTRLDAFNFLPMLATRAGLSAGTYDDLLSASLRTSDVVAAMGSSLPAGSAATAVAAIASSLNASGGRLTLGSLIDVGPYASLPVTQSPKLSVNVSALDVLSAVAQAANGNNQVSTSANLGLPNLGSVTVKAAIGERPQGSDWLTVGNEGATVRTAQTRIQLGVQVLGAAPVSLLNLPVYVQVASGTATLKKLSCGYPDIANSAVTLGVTPGIVDAWIGNVSAADMAGSAAPTPTPGTLTNLGPVAVNARAHATMGNTTPTDAAFAYADIQTSAKKTVTSTDFSSSLTAKLLGDMSLTIAPLNLAPPTLGSQVASTLSGATSSIDQVIASTLSLLGVGIGQADVWVSGLRCDGAVLVN